MSCTHSLRTTQQCSAWIDPAMLPAGISVSSVAEAALKLLLMLGLVHEVYQAIRTLCRSEFSGRGRGGADDNANAGAAS